MADLEERTIEQLPDRCQNCGATLTEAEKAAILETSSPLALCTICAAERVPIEEEASIDDGL